MPIALTCDCGRDFHIKDELAGKKIRCPACRNVLTVPEPQVSANPEDDALNVLLADSPAEETAQPRYSRDEEEPERTALRSERPERLPPEPEKLPEEKSRKKKHGPILVPREERRRKSGVSFEEGWFGSLNAGVIGGLLMILIAVVWFVGGLMAGIIFFYPPILLVIGIVAMIKGSVGGE